MTQRAVAVYQDYVHNHSSLLMALQDMAIPYRLVDAADITAGILDTQTFAAIVMPGGADLYYCEKLNGAGNAAIRSFVEAGGGYLGICAGAYYGCTALNWNKGDIAGPRELGFIDAVATGPIESFLQEGDINKSWYSAVTLEATGYSFLSLYGAGPVFKNVNGPVEVLARYTDAAHQPAVIGAAIGAGYAVLSGPHIEVTGSRFGHGRYTHRNAFAAYERGVAQALEPQLEPQQKFLTFIFKKLGIFS